jgi:citrate synthase
MDQTAVHADTVKLMRSFRYNAHPMGMLIAALASYATLHPEANPTANEALHRDPAFRNSQLYRLLGVVPTLAAMAYRLRVGREFNLPKEGLKYTENFLYMLDRLNQKDYRPHPKLVRALEVLFIIHAEHEVGCSTAFVRHLASAGVDLFTTVSMAAGALYGPKHGGANTAVIHML